MSFIIVKPISPNNCDPSLSSHVDGKRCLFFTTLLDTFEELEDGSSLGDIEYNRDFWTTKEPGRSKPLTFLFQITRPIFNNPSLNYRKSYIAITVGANNYLWLHKRSQDKSLLGFRVTDQSTQDDIAPTRCRKYYDVRKAKRFLMTVDKETIKTHADLFKSIASLVKKSWELKRSSV